MNGTLFNKINFFNYSKPVNGIDNSIIFFKGEAIVAVLPALRNHKTLISPYNSSFGGLILKSELKFNEMKTIIELFNKYLYEEKIKNVELTFFPNYLGVDNKTEYFLLKSGFEIESIDLFNVINLKKIKNLLYFYTPRARSVIKKIENNFIYHPNSNIDEFYPILFEDKKRHNSVPTHTLSELLLLKSRFKKNIWVDICINKENKSKSGICYFKLNKKSILTFYISQETNALKTNGTSYLINKGIEKSIREGFKFFDFGSSSNGFKVSNEGVYFFKESFRSKAFLRKKYSKKID